MLGLRRWRSSSLMSMHLTSSTCAIHMRLRPSELNLQTQLLPGKTLPLWEEHHPRGECATVSSRPARMVRSEEHTSELQSRFDLVCRLLLEKKKKHNRQS